MLGTTTMQLQDIDIFIATDWNSWDDLIAAKPPIAVVHYEYEPGQREIIHGDPDDCQPGFAASYRVHKIVLSEDAVFNGDCSVLTIKAGTDLYERVDPHFVSKLEDEITEAIAADFDSDYAAYEEAA